MVTSSFAPFDGVENRLIGFHAYGPNEKVSDLDKLLVERRAREAFPICSHLAVSGVTDDQGAVVVRMSSHAMRFTLVDMRCGKKVLI
jgi:hypothetical protein